MDGCPGISRKWRPIQRDLVELLATYGTGEFRFEEGGCTEKSVATDCEHRQ